MKESLLTLAKLLAEDEKFSKDFSSLKSVDEKYDFAQKSVKGYTKDEFVDFLAELEKSYELKKDVLPEDLEKVSGGANTKAKVAAVAMLALTAAGGISNFASMPVETSAVVKDNNDVAYMYSSIEALLKPENLNFFDYNKSSKGGDIREQLIKALNVIKNDLSSKAKFLEAVSNIYAEEQYNGGLTWIKSAGYTWTGWKFDVNEAKLKSKLEKNDKEAIVEDWILEQFKSEYWLYFKDNEIALKKGSEIIKLEDMNFNDERVSKEEFLDIMKKLGQKLNRARAFSEAMRSVGMVEEGKSIMRTEKEANIEKLAIKKYGEHSAEALKEQFLGYEDKELDEATEIYLKGRSERLETKSKELDDKISERERPIKDLEKEIEDLNKKIEGISKEDPEKQKLEKQKLEKEKSEKANNKWDLEQILRTFKNQKSDLWTRRAKDDLRAHKGKWNSVPYRAKLTEAIASLQESSDIKWIKHKAKMWFVGWTGYTFEIKPERLNELTKKAKNGDYYSRWILWLDSEFKSGNYLCIGPRKEYEGECWGLRNGSEFRPLDSDEYDNCDKSYTDFVKKNFDPELKEKISPDYKSLENKLEYYIGFSDLLRENGMMSEADAVMRLG